MVLDSEAFLLAHQVQLSEGSAAEQREDMAGNMNGYRQAVEDGPAHSWPRLTGGGPAHFWPPKWPTWRPLLT